MDITHVFAGVPVRDLAAAEAWYTRLFGCPPDNRPADFEVVWHLSGTGLIYVVIDPRRAGSGLLTLIVNDLDGVVSSLATAGIEVGPIATLPGPRKGIVHDPDGNEIGLAEVSGAA